MWFCNKLLVTNFLNVQFKLFFFVKLLALFRNNTESFTESQGQRIKK